MAARVARPSLVLFSVEERLAPHPRAAGAARVVKKAARAQLEALGQAHRELSVSLVSDRAIRRLNRAHRRKDKATDVLSFPQEERAVARRARGPIGDVVISLETALAQAHEGGWTLAKELERLLAHGLLHCLGFDHEAPADARKMALAETALLGRHGLVGSSLAQERSG